MRYREITRKAPVRVDGQEVPERLYHGTTDLAWKEIQETDVMLDDPDRPSGGICFSESARVAEEFARIACQNELRDEGRVIVVDGHALSREHGLIPFTDPTLAADYKIPNEHEFRVPGPRLVGIKRYVLDVYQTWKDSYDDRMEWGPGAEEWRS